ncbi:MAG: hypothetical protein U1F52_03385 [Burkholderiales bacterium]
MRKEYGQALRKLFEADLIAAAPGWEAVPVKSMYLFPGERAFRRVVSDAMHLWCVLVPDAKVDRFAVDIGWSRRARFPELSMRPSAGEPRTALSRDEFFCRLGKLAHGYDYWWVFEPFHLPASTDEMARQLAPVPAAEARARVAPMVIDAIAALKLHGEPYLAEAVRARGGPEGTETVDRT